MNVTHVNTQHGSYLAAPRGGPLPGARRSPAPTAAAQTLPLVNYCPAQTVPWPDAGPPATGWAAAGQLLGHVAGIRACEGTAGQRLGAPAWGGPPSHPATQLITSILRDK